MLTDALQRASTSIPSSIVLVGEPGIGKSRLANETAALAAERGFAIRWGRAWEAGGAPAYWPWRQLCDGLDRTGPLGQLWGVRAAGAADPDSARFELFDAVTHALSARCEAEPTLCIFDDLHVADVPSLELLAFATRHMRKSRIAWLLTWRDAEGSQMPVRDQLARIAREATIVPLSALTDADANELIDDVRRDADRELRGKLVRSTGGNPLFLLETLAALETGHVLSSELEQLPLAAGIAAIVHDRLAPLGADTLRLAQAAAVIGRDVTLDRWAAAANSSVEAAKRGALALAVAGLVTTLGPNRWRFGHDLVREAIYQSAGDGVVEIHRRLADVLDAAVIAGDSSLVGERAHHGLLAEGDPRRAIDWVIAAADNARAQCAYEEALAIVDRAIAKLGSVAQHDAALQLARGRALLDLGDAQPANEAFATAITLARKANDHRMVALAVLGLGTRYVLGDNLLELVAQIDDARAMLPESDRDLHARLLARKAAALTPAADPEPILEIAREANALVSDDADEATRLEVAVGVGAAFADFAHAHERIPINETMVALSRARGDRALELRGLSRLVTDYSQAGDFHRASMVLATRDALARSLVQPRFQWMEPLFRSMRAMMTGDFATCEAAIAEAEGVASNDPNARRACAVHRLWFYLHADRVDALAAHEPVVLDALRTMEQIVCSTIRANIRFRTGALDEARRELDAMAPDLAFAGGHNQLASIAEVAVECGTPARQRQLYDRLAPFADTYAGWGPFALTCGPPIAATLGNLAGALGDLDRARAHFESALAMTTADGAHVGRAWTSYWFGRTLATSNDAEAVRYLEDAIREATRLGMPHLAERARAISAPPSSAVAPTRPSAPSMAPPVPAIGWSIREQAGSWLVSHGDASFLVPNLRGMPMLERLAANPHVEIHSLELVSGSVDDVDQGDAGEVLDDKARAAYRKRIAQLTDAIEEAEARGNASRAEALRDEHETLMKELSRAVGLGGKVRRTGAAQERARVTAQRRLREAIKKIGELDEPLGTHLTKTIRTGMFCVYRP